MTLSLHSHCFSQRDGNNFFLWGGPAVSIFQMFPRTLSSTKDKTGMVILDAVSTFTVLLISEKKLTTYLALNLVTFIPIPKMVHFLFGIGN